MVRAGTDDGGCGVVDEAAGFLAILNTMTGLPVDESVGGGGGGGCFGGGVDDVDDGDERVDATEAGRGGCFVDGFGGDG